ncbi:dihydrofolate reductase [Pasteurella sp. PK-2025]|uniref:dihydrofolate reductase n=1 Tax=unclassified Pasteurella TaxID=2621516 RepID=UPI003C77B7F3
MISIKLIWSTDLNGVIGSTDGSLVYHDSTDMKHFKKTTIGNGRNAIVMGRKTAESIGHILKGRRNIILSGAGTLSNLSGFASYIPSPYHALRICEKDDYDELWVIGGAETYNLFLPFSEELIVTTFHFKSEFKDPVIFKPDLSKWFCKFLYQYTTEDGIKAEVKRYSRNYI